MNGKSGWIVAREDGCKLVGFIRMSGNQIVVTHEPYKDATVFNSEFCAKSVVCKLNSSNNSYCVWKAVKI